MDYYNSMRKSKLRIRTLWIPKVRNGEQIFLDSILYDLENNGFIYSEKAIKKYLSLVANVEGFVFDGEKIEK